MLTVLRHLLSILLLPFIVVVIVPALILLFWETDGNFWGMGSPLVWLGRIAGFVLGVAGLVLIGWCISLFARKGRGTLAPWDPPRNMVVSEPYQYVRNPMIVSGFVMVLGEALFWGSWRIAAWACFFLVMNHFYFVLSEEPGLEKRFGESYRVYKANVPRWIPRFRPWTGNQKDG